MNYDDHCPLCGGPPCDEDKHRRAQEEPMNRNWVACRDPHCPEPGIHQHRADSRCAHCRRSKNGYQFQGQPDPSVSYCKQCARWLSAELRRSADA